MGRDDAPPIRHRQLAVENVSIHVAEAGAPTRPPVLFLHGWPENWEAYAAVMRLLGEDVHAIAIDLPGIGESIGSARGNDKHTLARYVHSVIEALALAHVTLVGHDAGAQIAYAYLRRYPGAVERAVLMNIAIPGVDPWSEVVRNPHIFHFALHAVPKLPETLVTGREGAYFDFFYDALAANPDALTPELRATFVNAYARLESLRTGFDWYRAFAQDEKDNREMQPAAISTPVLYVRGDKDAGGITIERYLRGFRDAGLTRVRGKIIAGSGHFTPIEAPEGLAAALREFMQST